MSLVPFGALSALVPLELALSALVALSAFGALSALNDHRTLRALVP